MTDHVLAEVEVFGPDTCRVEPHASADAELTDVARSVAAGGSGEVVEEFTLAGDGGAAAEAEAVTEVFTMGSESVYRLSRPEHQQCTCEIVERTGCIVKDVSAGDDSLVVTFLADGMETLRSVITDLRETGESVSLRRLVDGSDDEGRHQPTVLDRGKLTDRQREVVERAWEMGYFEHPREATAGEVADALDICTSTFTEHLAAAQRKLLEDLVDR